MVKHTGTIRRQNAFDNFVGLVLKALGLKIAISISLPFPNLTNHLMKVSCYGFRVPNFVFNHVSRENIGTTAVKVVSQGYLNIMASGLQLY